MGADQRYGPNPVLDGTVAATASGNKAILLKALAADAGYAADVEPDWYEVSQAGFNYVDDQCRSYFDEIFFLDRGRQQLKSGLAAGAQTTAAILAATHAAAPTLAIVAQAFGFASAATDIGANTYLYQLPPATTLGFVEKLQLAYRGAAAQNRSTIRSPATAYYSIQRYLNLCLPATIEAELTKQIASTTAFGVQKDGSGLFSVETASASPVLQRLVAQTKIISPLTPMAPLERRRHPIIDPSPGVDAPNYMSKGDVAHFRQLVGEDPAGPLDLATVGKLKACLAATTTPTPVGPANSLSRKEVFALRDLDEEHKNCPEK